MGFILGFSEQEEGRSKEKSGREKEEKRRGSKNRSRDKRTNEIPNVGIEKAQENSARLKEELQKNIEKENIDLEHQPIQITEAYTETLEEKSCPLKKQFDHIDAHIPDEQIDADILDEHSDVDIQGEQQHIFYETYDIKLLEDRKEVEMVDEHCDEMVHKQLDVMVLNAIKK